MTNTVLEGAKCALLLFDTFADPDSVRIRITVDPYIASKFGSEQRFLQKIVPKKVMEIIGCFKNLKVV